MIVAFSSRNVPYACILFEVEGLKLLFMSSLGREQDHGTVCNYGTLYSLFTLTSLFFEHLEYRFRFRQSTGYLFSSFPVDPNSYPDPQGPGYLFSSLWIRILIRIHVALVIFTDPKRLGYLFSSLWIRNLIRIHKALVKFSLPCGFEFLFGSTRPW